MYSTEKGGQNLCKVKFRVLETKNDLGCPQGADAQMKGMQFMKNSLVQEKYFY